MIISYQGSATWPTSPVVENLLVEKTYLYLYIENYIRKYSYVLILISTIIATSIPIAAKKP